MKIGRHNLWIPRQYECPRHAVSPAGLVVGALVPGNNFNDGSNNLTRINHDGTGFAAVNVNINTFFLNNATPRAVAAHNVGLEFTALAYTDTSANDDGQGGQVALFGVARRGDDAPFDGPTLSAANPPVINGNRVNNSYKNIVYRLDPTTLAPINQPMGPFETDCRLRPEPVPMFVKSESSEPPLLTPGIRLLHYKKM